MVLFCYFFPCRSLSFLFFAGDQSHHPEIFLKLVSKQSRGKGELQRLHNSAEMILDQKDADFRRSICPLVFEIFLMYFQLNRNFKLLVKKHFPSPSITIVYPTPPKTPCPLKRCHVKRKVVFQPLFFGGHVNFQGSIIGWVPLINLMALMAIHYTDRFMQILEMVCYIGYNPYITK